MITAIPFVIIITRYIKTGLPLMLKSLSAALIGLLSIHAWYKKLIDEDFFLKILDIEFIYSIISLDCDPRFVLASTWLVIACFKKPFSIIALTLCMHITGVGLSRLENSMDL